MFFVLPADQSKEANAPVNVVNTPRESKLIQLGCDGNVNAVPATGLGNRVHRFVGRGSEQVG
jgi:hypothetical protein